VSEVPGRAWANTCHSRLVLGMPETSSSDMRRYWLPTRPRMFSHCGCSDRPRVQGVEGDVAGTAGGADAERRLDGRVGEMADIGIGALGIVGQAAVIAVPTSQAAIELAPRCPRRSAGWELAVAQLPGRGAEGQVAGTLARALVALGIVAVRWRILEVAGRIAVALPADELQQFFVAGTPVEAVGLVEALRGAIGCARRAAARIIDQAPGNGSGGRAGPRPQHPPQSISTPTRCWKV